MYTLMFECLVNIPNHVKGMMIIAPTELAYGLN